MSTIGNIYEPLKQEPVQIRLVTVRPARQTSQRIECDLEICSLDKKPQYEALSYVWGTEDYADEISLNGHVFPILTNLYDALRHLRLANKSRTLWIDAICISQTDKDERSFQILFMRQVFGWASRVVIWLGVETPETGSAFQLLKWVNGITKFDGNVDAAPSQSDLTKVMMHFDADPSAEKSLSCLFHGLLTQEWWRRAWVIQEAAVSSRATVVVGRSELEWSSLYDAVGIIVQCGAVPLQLSSASSRATISSISSLTNIEMLRTKIRRGSLPSISTLVASNQQAATDPRDLVYAFLGLAQKYDDSLLRPNYSDSNSVSTVFLNLVEHTIRVERSPDIICRSQGGSRNDLPSWCPDWTSPPPSMGWKFDSDSPVHAPIPLISNYASLLASNTWHACGETTPAARIIRSPPTLACKGLFIDK